MKVIISFLSLFSIQLFAGIGVGYSPVGSLPVELTSFTAKQSVSGVELYWVTATEVNNFGFDVERSYLLSPNDKTIWVKIGFISGHGNSDSPNNYSFIDNKPDRKSTRLNSSHLGISYAVFCLKKKKNK